jgi:glycerol-3-phosphate acyltransferase PlsY
MEIITTSLLALASFGLAAVPFSLLIGRWFLGKDIRQYGDGNPGATNVFRAGGQKTGYLALALDVGKGVPFVLLAHYLFNLPGPALVVVAMSAVLGHAFSPLLRWRGGKAVAVTFGVLVALPQHEMLVSFVACMVLGFLIIEVDAWTVVFGAAGSLAYTALAGGGSWETLLMFCLLILLTLKQLDGLHTFPGFRGRLVRWLQSLVRGTMSII